MDWTKHASGKQKAKAAKPKRIALQVKPELQQAIEAFKSRHPEVTKDTAVLMTMIEAGFQQWVTYIKEEAQKQQTQQEETNDEI